MCFSLYAILINRTPVEKNELSTEKWFLNHFSTESGKSIFVPHLKILHLHLVLVGLTPWDQGLNLELL